MPAITKLDAKAFAEVLKRYDIGSYVSHKHVPFALGNTVYAFRTTSGKFVLKVFEESDRKLVSAQARIMRSLEHAGLPSPKIENTIDGKPVTVSGKKIMMVQCFVEGHFPLRLTKSLLVDIASKEARMDALLRTTRAKDIPDWGKDYLSKPRVFEANSYGSLDIIGEDKTLTEEMASLNTKKLRRGIIHGDFHSVNLLAKKDKVTAILDWDDVHKDFMSQEIATTLAHSFLQADKVMAKGLRLYLDTYCSGFRLNAEERISIYPFMKLRLLGVVAWNAMQIKKHPDRAWDIKSYTGDFAKSYKALAALGPERFMKLIND